MFKIFFLNMFAFYSLCANARYSVGEEKSLQLWVPKIEVQSRTDPVRIAEREFDTEAPSQCDKDLCKELESEKFRKLFESYRPVLNGVHVFKFSHVNMENTRDCKNNENVVQRTVTFVGEVCLTDTLTNNKARNVPFRVFLEKPNKVSTDKNKMIIEEIFHANYEKKQNFQTDGRGCIHLPISIKHNIYNRQQYFPVNIHFLSEEWNFYAQVKAALNPWAIRASQDTSKLSEKATRMDTTGIQKPKLVIDQFRVVDLELVNEENHFYHKLTLLLQPFIQRYDNMALDLDHRSRELLRDGYYIIRTLVFQDPHEKEGFDQYLRSQVDTEGNYVYVSRDYVYVSHTDTVVKLDKRESDYLPLHYKLLNSDNSNLLFSIEVIPVDPESFVFKSGRDPQSCELDLDKTVWRPYFNHDLISKPYIGILNIQNVNWNILSPSESLNTDAIIESSPIGRKHKHFNLHSPS